MEKLKQKIISLDKDKIHLICIKNDAFTQEQFDMLSRVSEGVGLRALIIAVEDVNNIKVDEIGKVNITLADGKVVDIERCVKK